MSPAIARAITKVPAAPRRSQEATRGRLLAAAGEVFAARGFRAATVREICSRARANVAAVNYHFGDKGGLYSAVIRLAHRASSAKYPVDLGVGPGASPAERLRAFVHSFLLRIFDEGQPAWLGKLMSREILEPTPALDSLVREQFRPRWALLESIAASIAPGGLSRREARLAAMSVVGQCLFYFHSRSIIDRLYPGELDRPGAIERLSEHIARFSLRALGKPVRAARSRSVQPGSARLGPARLGPERPWPGGIAP